MCATQLSNMCPGCYIITLKYIKIKMSRKRFIASEYFVSIAPEYLGTWEHFFSYKKKKNTFFLDK